MGVLIKMCWDRNPDKRTKKYRVYRSGVPGVNRNSTLIAEIRQPEDAIAVKVTNEKLVLVDNLTYQAKHMRIFPNSNLTPLRVLHGGAELTPTDYTVDYDRGIFIVRDGLSPTVSLIADYYFDGVEFYDRATTQTGVTYHGPAPENRVEPAVPEDVTLTSDPVNNRAILSWSLSETQVLAYYYRVEAVDEEGHYSQLSPEQPAFIYSRLADRPSIIERSIDGETNWSIAARLSRNMMIISNLDNEPPDPVSLLRCTITLRRNEGLANILLTWINPAADKGIPTLYYRVRSISENGITSAPSAKTAPVIVRTGLDSLIIRRKIYDGSVPTPTGADATTIATITDFGVRSLEDNNLDDKTHYIYAIYTKDEAGNYSVAATVHADITDTTPPAKVVNVRSVVVEL